MCRWLFYTGERIRLSSLITEPVHSLIHQSYEAELRKEPLNGDGFGIAWYRRDLEEEPAVFRSVQPAWNSVNLASVCQLTESDTVLAHVRAATPGLGVAEQNCHPFRHGKLAFMHNGYVPEFSEVKRSLQQRLSDEAFLSINGTTDSEHVFALFRDRYDALDEKNETERLAKALCSAIAETVALRESEDTYQLNLCVTDGQRTVATRFSQGPDPANSLFVHHGRRYTCVDGVTQMVDPDEAGGAVIIASEPLSRESGWDAVGQNEMVIVDEQRNVDMRRIDDLSQH